jgi:hypothetical protein
MNEQLEFLKTIARRLQSAHIPFMLTGSVAMSVYATPRMTRDIDLVVEVGPVDAHRIWQLFQPDCYADLESIREAAAQRTQFNIIHNEWIIKADFIVRKDGLYRETEFGRRRKLEIEGTTVWVVAPEDLVLSKLVWSRESGSEIQRRDAKAIADSVACLDWEYLERWAGELGVGGMLHDLRT